MRNTSEQSGSIIVSIMVIMIFLTMTVLSLSVVSQTNITRAAQRIFLLQAQYAAESGADAAVAYLNSSTGTYPESGTEKLLFTDSPTYRATYQATISDTADPNQKSVMSIGRVYQPSTATVPKLTYKLQVTLERSSTEFTSSIVSRNSVEIASSVKAVIATSLFVNEYVRANKNTSEVAINDLTIAGKYPDGGNCSLSGSGDLTRSSDLPVGTKAKLRMAFSNCMALPLVNSRIKDFDNIENDSTIQKIASTYIPWGYKMNNADGNGEYTNGNCTDWSAASPVSIPSAGNDRKTHYPDTGAGTASASACGGSGSAPADLNLGSKTYVIKDHVHVRAHFCKASDCTPTFINPDAGTTKFVFIEGVMNFQNIKIDSSSPGNIIFISYSTSQSLSDSKQCPSNSAAIRLGKDGSISLYAPKAYFIATNGMLCLDQTKFDSGVKSLGGISGKDIYISSNSGATFELAFNPEFPLSTVPLDLSWRSTNIKRVY